MEYCLGLPFGNNRHVRQCAGASHTHFTGYRRCTKTVSTSPTRGNYVRNLWAATVEEDCRLTNEFQRRLSSPYVAWEAWVVTVIFEMSGQFGKIPLAEESGAETRTMCSLTPRNVKRELRKGPRNSYGLHSLYAASILYPSL